MSKHRSLPVRGSVKRHDLASYLWAHHHDAGKWALYEQWRALRKKQADDVRAARKAERQSDSGSIGPEAPPLAAQTAPKESCRSRGRDRRQRRVLRRRRSEVAHATSRPASPLS